MSSVSSVPPSQSEHFQAFLEAVPDATLVVDRQGHVVLANAHAERLFGYARDELLGQLVEVLVPPRLRSRHRQQRDGFHANPHTRPMGRGGQLYAVKKDGTEFPADISLAPLAGDGEHALAITAIRDVSERLRAEAERARLHARLEALLADQQRFFAQVSHELRTPLTLVMGAAGRLTAAGDRRPEVEVIARNARTLLTHVEELLEVARLDAGEVSLHAAPSDVAALVRLAGAHFEVVALERGVAFAVEAPPALTAVVDAPKLQRVLQNLLSNAFRFTPQGGRIRASLRAAAGPDAPSGGLVLEVADSGPGIPEADRAAVFVRFRQLGNPAAGTGLGLSIAKEFVELHGGRIEADRAPEGGALFRVFLPPLAAPAEAAPTPVPDAAALAGAAEALRPRPVAPALAEGAPRVLVAEDHPDMAAYIRDVLAPGASVEVARSGREALARALAGRPDLIVTDLMMPDGTGQELLAEVRRRPEFDAVPVVVLTARGEEALRVELLRTGAQDFVVKPFSPEELRARVDGLLAAKRARDVLQEELGLRTQDLGELAGELARRKREVEAALRVAEGARDEAHQASRVKSDFLALVSHELRTPLTSLQLQLGLLSRDQVPEARERALRRLNVATGRLSGLVESLLQQARLASGHVPLRWELVDLRRVTEEAVDELRPAAEQKGLELRVEVDPALTRLWSDPVLLRLVVTNLVGNAVKFTVTGVVAVALGPEVGGQLLTVTDTGPGIPAEQQRAIFEPFTQLAPIQRKHVPGIGLGLALVKQVSAALHARLELHSQVGRGTVFCLHVPTGERLQPAEFVPELGTLAGPPG